VGRSLTHAAVWALEGLRIAPRGTAAVSSFLVKGADALVAGGRQDIFTPMFFMLVRKPLDSAAARAAAPAAAPAAAGEEAAARTLRSPGARTRKAAAGGN